MKKSSILFLFIVVLLVACEDEIDVTLDEGESQLVVDGFISNDSSLQTIRLSMSADYFLNAPTPTIENAIVKVHGPNNTVYNFTHSDNGNFNYDPQTLGAMDSISFPYKLEIEYNANTYTSISTLQAVPKIDSMTHTFEKASIFNKEGYYAQFYARDFAGREDWYWIKAYKNGTSIQRNPTDFTFSKDGGFMGAEADGLEFIAPIRSSINKRDEPYAIGDEVTVELLSINETAYEFLQQAVVQANNGGLFSTPPSNIKSNIKVAVGNSQTEVLGVFSIAAISNKNLTITSQ